MEGLPNGLLPCSFDMSAGVPFDIYCPRPGRRWRPGEPGPCGKRIGWLHVHPSGAMILYSRYDIDEVAPGRYVAEGNANHPNLERSSAGYRVQAPASATIECAECGVVTKLARLTRKPFFAIVGGRRARKREGPKSPRSLGDDTPETRTF